MLISRHVLWLAPFVLLSGCSGWWPFDPGGLGGGGEVSYSGLPAGGGTGEDFTSASACAFPPERGVSEQGVTPAPITGGTMVALQSGGFVIADADRALVWLVSADFKQVRSVALLPTDDPGRVIEGAPGVAWVSLRRAGQVAEINFATGALRRLTTCDLPRGLAWNVTDSRLIVACLGGELEKIDPVSSSRSAVITSAPLSDLRDVVVDGARLIVTRWRSAEVLSIDSTGVVTEVPTPSVVDASPHVAWRAVARPTGGAMVVRQQHRTSRFPAPSPCLGSYGSDLGIGQGSGAVESEVVAVSGGASSRVSLGGGKAVVLPVDMAVSRTGRLAVVSAGTGAVSILGLGERRDVPVVSHDTDTQLTSVVFVNETVVAFAREPAALFAISPEGAAELQVRLGGSASISTGHELFHRSTLTNIACASCHPEAGEDGHVWPFAEGDRRTPTLRGGIGGTAPFHWAGDMSTMSALMTTVMSERMLGPALTEQGVQSVEDWLSLQPALPAPRVDENAKARGEAAFVSAGCRACHAGTQGTNNATVDVGTGQAFQVPRLVEFAWRAPWFHDGRMQKLEDRFLPAAGGLLHGNTETLTPQQREDLLVFLQSQ